MKNLIKDVKGRTCNIALKVTLVLFVICVLLIAPLAGNLTTSAAGGSYTIDYTAADPGIYVITFPPGPTCPTGRGNDPIPNAYNTNPTTFVDESVNVLSGTGMVLGQIVPFEIKITVSGSTTPENGQIEFTAGWSTQTTSSDAFGYDESKGVLCAFVDILDGAHIDPGGDATVTSNSSILVGNEIQGTIGVYGLEDGDVVVVEVWVVLDDTFPIGSHGNVQSRLISAQTTHSTPETISVGGQNIPLNQIGDISSIHGIYLPLIISN